MARKVVCLCFLLIVLFLFQEEGLKAEEIPKLYQIVVSEPDGRNGYYKRGPEVGIKHMDENFTTRYQLDCPGGEKIVGRLENKAKSERISQEMFGEGKYKLNVWMEDERGQVISGTEQTKELNIDGSPPTLAMQHAETVVEIKAKDAISGVVGIYYRVGAGEEQYIKGNHAFVSVPREFQGMVVSYATDYAGNVSETYEHPIEKLQSKKKSAEGTESEEVVKKNSKEEEHIIQEKVTPKLWIEGFEDNTIVGKNVSYTCRVSGISQVESIAVRVVCENEKEKKKTVEFTDWEEEESQYILKGELSKEGRYAISVEVSDLDGTEYKEKRHVIVDKTNPLIQKLEELNNAQLKSFQWDYSIDEIVKEFTTYSYEIRLDGALCDSNRVYTEQGKHVLELLVIDGAGNESRATATFYIVGEKEESSSVLRWIWPSILLLGIGLIGFVWVFKKKGP